jgi:quercetin dioxygenase-like cupin family protein
MHTQRADDIEWTSIAAADDTEMQVLIPPERGPNFAMRRIRIAPGGSMPPHTNEIEHEQYVLSGRAAVGIGDQTYQVSAGSVVHIPARVPHWYRTEGDEAFQFLCMVPSTRDEIKLVE